MRYGEILNESIIRLQNEVVIYKNPLKNQVLYAIQQSVARAHKIFGGRDEGAELRGFVAFSDVYIWNAWDGTHTIVAEWMEEQGYISDDLDPTDIVFYITQKDNKIVVLDAMQQPMFFSQQTDGEKIIKRWVDRLN